MYAVLPLPFPAGIYGIVLLYAALSTGMLKVKHIKEVSTTLIAAMPVMFVPPAVGLMETWSSIRDVWPQYMFITIVSTLAVMAAAGWMTQGAIMWKGHGKARKEEQDEK